jgi:ribulose-5-phosphate 4-epimerase/fuculose-1-phosphate aldolase
MTNAIAPQAVVETELAALETERRLRVELAATYRLVAHFRMTDLIFTHISVRIPGPEHHFLINPYGLFFEEITASSLVKIDLDGNAVGSSQHEVNPAGFVIHSAVHAAREDAQCVLHTHTRAGCAVAAQKSGLLPLNQISLEFYGRVAYHDYEGISLNLDERTRLVNDLGSKPVMILRNHGLLTVGRTPAEAFVRMHNLNRACEIQVDALAGGAEITLPSAELSEHVARQFQGAAGDDLQGDPDADTQLIWSALLRLLDRVSPGYDA